MDTKNLAETDSIIFDLDGTLWDASESCSNAWNRTLEAFGFEQHRVDQAVIRSFSGMKIEDIFEKHFGFIPQKSHETILESYRKDESYFMRESGGKLFPNVRETLEILKKDYKLYIVSNCLSGYIENFIAFHNLEDLFTDFESSGNTGKPKSDNIKLIVERNSMQNPIYVGDTIWDFEAAQKANIPFVYAIYGFGDVKTAKHRIEGISELQMLLQTQPNL